MEFIGLIAAIIGIVTGIWFLWEKISRKPHEHKIDTSKDSSLSETPQESLIISRIELEKTPLFNDAEVLYLSKITVLIGNNGVGKTAVCEWLSGLEGVKNLKRWINPSNSLPIILSIVFKKNQIDHILRLKFTGNALAFNLDGNDVPANPYPFRFIFAAEKRFSRDRMDDADILAKYLDIDKVTLQNYASRVGSSFYCTVRSIKFVNEGSKTNVYVDIEGTLHDVRFGALSGSEKGRVIIELAIAIAQFLSSTVPVILVIERNSFSLDRVWAQKYADWILKKDFNFQTLITSIPLENDVDWTKFEVAEFIGNRPCVKIRHKSGQI